MLRYRKPDSEVVTLVGYVLTAGMLISLERDSGGDGRRMVVLFITRVSSRTASSVAHGTFKVALVVYGLTSRKGFRVRVVLAIEG